MREFDYHQPENLSGFLRVMEQVPEARIVAGGTDLMVLIKDLLLEPPALISLAGLKDLAGIQAHGDGLILGPMTPLWRLERSEAVSRMYPALHQAVLNLAVPPIRNQATLGGNICLDTKCIYYNQSHVWERNLPRCLKAGGEVCHVAPGGKRCVGALVAETAGPLWVYGAELTLTSSRGTRRLPIGEFYTGDGLSPHDLDRGEVVTGVYLPPPSPRSGAAYRRFAFRKALEFSQFNASAALDLDVRGRILRARLVVGAVGPAPVELQESLSPLVGQSPSSDLWTEVAQRVPGEAARLAQTPRLTPYLRDVLSAYAERLLKEAFERAQSGNA